jgi:hypothetical protein
VIQFAIGTGSYTIQPRRALPALTDHGVCIGGERQLLLYENGDLKSINPGNLIQSNGTDGRGGCESADPHCGQFARR